MPAYNFFVLLGGSPSADRVRPSRLPPRLRDALKPHGVVLDLEDVWAVGGEGDWGDYEGRKHDLARHAPEGGVWLAKLSAPNRSTGNASAV
eukprot:gene50674-10379_t